MDKRLGVARNDARLTLQLDDDGVSVFAKRVGRVVVVGCVAKQFDC